MQTALIVSIRKNIARICDQAGQKTSYKIPDHLPLRKDDIICFSVHDEHISVIHRFFFPNVLASYDSAINKISGRKLSAIFGDFCRHHPYTEHGFLEFLERAAAQWRFSNRCAPRDLSKFFETMGRDWRTEKFLRYFYEERVERSLILIGLEKIDIEECPLDPLTLRRIISGDIWQGYFLPPERCLQIARTRCQPCSAEQALAHSVVYKIFSASRDWGWTGFPRIQLLALQTPFGKVNEQILTLATEIYKTHDIGADVQLNDIFLAEKRVGEYLARLLLHNRHPKQEDLPEILSKDLISDEQRQAIYGSCRHHLSIVTGAAGTGKTFVISQVYRILRALRKKVMVASFTGKAVARLNEVLPKSVALTLDMAISSAKIQGKFRRIDVLIIDEFSMVSTELLFRFISNYNKQFFRIILVGDINQLDAISWGNFASTILQFAPTFRLSYNYRSVLPDGQPNYIVQNSERILSGQRQLISAGNFFIPPVQVNEKSLQRMLEELHQQGITSQQFIVITPYREPTSSLNNFCQRLFTKADAPRVTDIQGNDWIKGDKVRSRQNDYERNVMNGQEGYIIRVTDEVVDINFAGRIVRYTKNQLHYYLSLGYAITVHLSQGSEWDIVLFYLPTYSRPDSSFLNKTLLYTALTRGRRWIICLAESEKLQKIIETPRQEKISHLADHINRVLQENI